MASVTIMIKEGSLAHKLRWLVQERSIMAGCCKTLRCLCGFARGENGIIRAGK